MSEAINILKRSYAGYADRLTTEKRRLEKAEDGSEAAREVQGNIDTVKLIMADISDALTRLGDVPG